MNGLADTFCCRGRGVCEGATGVTLVTPTGMVSAGIAGGGGGGGGGGGIGEGAAR
jgi:hypothetical protein